MDAGFCRSVGHLGSYDNICRKISEITRPYSSALPTHREESYLDKTILGIFSACRPKDGN